jgi:hypothetical protein
VDAEDAVKRLLGTLAVLLAAIAAFAFGAAVMVTMIARLLRTS